MVVNILYLGIFLAMVAQEQKCEDTVLHSSTSALEAYITEWFPQHIEFNESCLVEDCPALKNIVICPIELEIDAMRDITHIISDCMSGSMCGIVIDPRPLNYLVASLDDVLPGLELNGIVTFPSGAGYLSNISNIQLDMLPNEKQHGTLQMTMLIPNIRIYGRLELDFRLETVFGPDLTARLTQSSYDIEIQFISTIITNKTISGTKFDIKFVNPIIRARPVFCGIGLPSGFPVIQSLMTTTLQMLYETSSMAKAIGQFMGRLYKGIFKVLSSYCQSKNATF